MGLRLRVFLTCMLSVGSRRPILTRVSQLVQELASLLLFILPESRTIARSFSETASASRSGENEAHFEGAL
jgi:hypothetical protein